MKGTVCLLFITLLIVTVHAQGRNGLVDDVFVRILSPGNFHAEPFRDYPITAAFYDCDLNVDSEMSVKTRWVFADGGDGEATYEYGLDTTHQFVGTGRRTVRVEVCLTDDDDSDIASANWCQDDDSTLVFEEVEFIVQFVRRELRDMPQEEWDQFVDAMWTIKQHSTTELRNLYGPAAINWDDITVWHYAGSMNATCDQLHFFESFHTYHRAMIYIWERSIQSIYPHLSLPYWDQSYDNDNFANPIYDSAIFSSQYYGGPGVAEHEYRVMNGPFGSTAVGGDFSQTTGEGNGAEYEGWPIRLLSEVPKAAEPEYRDVIPGNFYRQFRAPWNSNKIQQLSRRTGVVADAHDPLIRFQREESRLACVNAPDYPSFQFCQDQGLEQDAHGWPHIIIGGMSTTPGLSSFEEIRDAYDADASWAQYGIPSFIPAFLISMLIRSPFQGPMYFAGGTICPTPDEDDDLADDDCHATLDDDELCVCFCDPNIETNEAAQGLAFGLFDFRNGGVFPVYGILDDEDPRNICNGGAMTGEFLDGNVSPTDPLFWPFHSDLDRSFVEWQQGHIDLGPQGGWFSGVCPGHFYDDIPGGAQGFSFADMGWGDSHNLIRNSDIMNIMIPSEFGTETIIPYRYVRYSGWGEGGEDGVTPAVDRFIDEVNLCAGVDDADRYTLTSGASALMVSSFGVLFAFCFALFMI